MPHEPDFATIADDVRTATSDEWKEKPEDIRIPLASVHGFGEEQELVFDIVYDNFCMPLGSRCRTIINPTIDKFKFTCCERPKKLFGSYKHKKEIKSGCEEFDSKFVIFGKPTGNIRYLFWDARIQEILLQLEDLELKPILKISVNKHLTNLCKEKIYTLCFRTEKKIDKPDVVVLIFELLFLTLSKLIKMGSVSNCTPEITKCKTIPEMRLKTCSMGKIDWVQNTSSN
mmetsp:Transcript_2777/g.3949  ORF Transcript_2777/g.3949 Transcript_2777/m.3949 type:complete len:229 (+) Transcript_2777:27-713(+)